MTLIEMHLQTEALFLEKNDGHTLAHFPNGHLFNDHDCWLRSVEPSKEQLETPVL